MLVTWQIERLTREVVALEKDTGVKLRVLSQARVCSLCLASSAQV
jgi:hypothetical protein